jgi:uncharacterized membrane protein (UPF0127 family)
VAWLVLLLGAFGACRRTPDERVAVRDATQPTTPPATQTTTAHLTPPASDAIAAGPAKPVERDPTDAREARPRCVKPTPATPPPPVPPGPARGCPPDPMATPPPLARATIRFLDATGAPPVQAEIASRPAETQRGLMYRTRMAEDEGMIFRMGERREHTFWMHNTCIPLDMMFIDDDGLIVGILENVPTLNDDPRTVGCPSSWVLEVNAGFARKYGVRAGQKVSLPGSR